MGLLDKHRNENGTYDGIGVMSSLTGLSRQSMLEIHENVKANHAKLDGCSGHDFSLMPDPRQRKRLCTVCGGEVDVVSALWYERGSRDALAKLAREVGDGS